MNKTEENLQRIRTFSRDNEGRMAFDDWDESKHPRRPDGKFGSGGGATPKAKGSTSQNADKEMEKYVNSFLNGKEPTKANVTAACKEIVEMLTQHTQELKRRASTARRQGDEQAAKELEKNIKKQEDRINAAYKIAMAREA